MRYFISLALIAMLAAISACGWHLRGGANQTAPSELNFISANSYSPLTLTFNEAIQQRAIIKATNADLQLHIGEETLDKRTVAVTNIGSPSQYELSLTVSYRYLFAKDNQTIVLPRSVSVYRVFDFDPSNTVAKNEEENTLLTEMRRELTHRILQKMPKLEKP